MSHSHRLIILSCLLFTTTANAAAEFYADLLYWRATETVDWVLNNDLSPPNQSITYGTINFHYDPGFRIGAIYNNDWYNKFYYTSYFTKASSGANGNLVSTFLAGKLSTPDFYRSGQINFSINFNTIDWDFGKKFDVSDLVMILPKLGLRAGFINQKIITNMQGTINSTETVKNNFKGFGPKAGIETELKLHNHNNYQLLAFADFTTSYLWGNWDITDVLTDSVPETITINIGSRNFGAFTVQALLGLGLDYKHLSMKLGYEVLDWFDQYQVLDDGTGANNIDLILQGLTFRVSYGF